MATRQTIGGVTFPVYVNETGTRQSIAGGVYVDETVAVSSGIVVGWLRSDDDRLPVAPRVFQPPGVFALTPPAAPASTISGIAWFEPPDPKQPRPLERPHPAAAITIAPPDLLSKVQGIGWFSPLDVLPRPPPRQQPNAATALTPATLPPQIAGIGWFEPPDTYQPRRSFVQDAPAYAQLVVAAPVVTVVYGWWPSAQDASRAKPLSEDRPPPLGLQPTAAPNIGWIVAPEAAGRKVAPRSDVPAFAFTGFAIPVIWTQPYPEMPPRPRARGPEAPSFASAAPTSASTIAGMAWFAPPEAPRYGLRLSGNATAAWMPQDFTQLTPTTVDVVHCLPIFVTVGSLKTF